MPKFFNFWKTQNPRIYSHHFWKLGASHKVLAIWIFRYSVPTFSRKITLTKQSFRNVLYTKNVCNSHQSVTCSVRDWLRKKSHTCLVFPAKKPSWHGPFAISTRRPTLIPKVGRVLESWGFWDLNCELWRVMARNHEKLEYADISQTLVISQLWQDSSATPCRVSFAHSHSNFVDSCTRVDTFGIQMF